MAEHARTSRKFASPPPHLGAGMQQWFSTLVPPLERTYMNIRMIDTSTRIDRDDTILICDTSSNNVTVTLPPVDQVTGKIYWVKKSSGSNTLTLDGHSSEQIDGSATQALTDNNYAIGVVSDGDSWSIIAELDTGSGSVTTLSGLTDVSITSVADNEVLAYDSGSGDWINQTAAEAGLSATGHTHVKADITDLGTFLDGSAAETITGDWDFDSDIFIESLTVGPQLSGDGFLTINTDAAGEVASITFQTNGSNRWLVAKDSDAESGSNAGSTFKIGGYADNASFLGYYLTIDRATGDIDIPLGTLAWGGGSAVSSSDDVASSLSGLTDTTITSIASSELLQWNGSAWINRTIAEAGLAEDSHTHTTSDITDISDYANRTFVQTISGSWNFTGTQTFSNTTTFTAKADIQADADIEGDLVLGDGSGHTFLYIDSDSSSVSRIEFREGTTRRWLMQKDGADDLVWHGYNAAGTHLGQWMKMDQSSERVILPMDGGLLIRSQSDGLLLWEDFTNSQAIVSSTGTDDLVLQCPSAEQIIIDDGGTNTARAASVKAITSSGTTPTGDYPYGTLHLIY